MSSEVQLSENEMLNKKVLSWRRKVRNDEAVRRDAGSAATENARSPRLDRLVAGTNKVDVEPDLRRRCVQANGLRLQLNSNLATAVTHLALAILWANQFVNTVG